MLMALTLPVHDADSIPRFCQLSVSSVARCSNSNEEERQIRKICLSALQYLVIRSNDVFARTFWKTSLNLSGQNHVSQNPRPSYIFFRVQWARTIPGISILQHLCPVFLSVAERPILNQNLAAPTPAPGDICTSCPVDPPLFPISDLSHVCSSIRPLCMLRLEWSVSRLQFYERCIAEDRRSSNQRHHSNSLTATDYRQSTAIGLLTN